MEKTNSPKNVKGFTLIELLGRDRHHRHLGIDHPGFVEHRTGERPRCQAPFGYQGNSARP